jgi:hypothetical protein
VVGVAVTVECVSVRVFFAKIYHFARRFLFRHAYVSCCGLRVTLSATAKHFSFSCFGSLLQNGVTAVPKFVLDIISYYYYYYYYYYSNCVV